MTFACRGGRSSDSCGRGFFSFSRACNRGDISFPPSPVPSPAPECRIVRGGGGRVPVARVVAAIGRRANCTHHLAGALRHRGGGANSLKGCLSGRVQTLQASLAALESLAPADRHQVERPTPRHLVSTSSSSSSSSGRRGARARATGSGTRLQREFLRRGGGHACSCPCRADRQWRSPVGERICSEADSEACRSSSARHSDSRSAELRSLEGSLSEEVLLRCLSFLSAHDLVTVSRVSSAWYRLAQDPQVGSPC